MAKKEGYKSGLGKFSTPVKLNEGKPPKMQKPGKDVSKDL